MRTGRRRSATFKLGAGRPHSTTLGISSKMGAEYKLIVKPLKAQAFDQALRGLRGFGGYDPALKVYTINDPAAAATVPIAKVAFVRDGLIFEDLLTKPVEASHILRALVDVAIRNEAHIQIEDA